MKGLFYFLFVAIMIDVVTLNPLSAQHYLREELESGKIKDLYRGVPVVEKYDQIKKCIVRLAEPDQNLAREAKTSGVVICQALIDEKGTLQAVYFNQSLHPILDRAVIDSLRISKFKTFREVAGKRSRYSLLLFFPFYPSSIDRRSAQMVSQNRAIPHDKAPQPVGGFAAIQHNLKYPELARQMGAEGRVIIGFIVDEQGRVGEFEVMEPLWHGMIESSIEAIRAVKWRPAELDGQPVAVVIAIPLLFKLR